MAVNDAPPIDDHYATLGVAPRSEDVVIRAAYLALMRRYHPDASRAPASAERARAIIAAFAVLGDPEKRLHYDWHRRRVAEALARPRRGRRGGVRLALAAAVVLLLLAVPLALMVTPPTAPDRVPVVRPAPTPPVPPSAPPARAIAAAARPEPGPATTADQAVARPPTAKAPRAAPAPSAQAEVRAEAKAAKPAGSANSDCGPGGAAAACQDDNIAALDRLALAFYGQSLRAGNPAKRAALLVSRSSLLGQLESCRSEPCLRSAYLTHIREISAIVESRPLP